MTALPALVLQTVARTTTTSANRNIAKCVVSPVLIRRSSTVSWNVTWNQRRRLARTTTPVRSWSSSSSSSSSILPLQNESFEVTKVDVATGNFETVCLTPYEILQQTKSILPRDLVSLALTSRERRRSHAFSKSRQQRGGRGQTSVTTDDRKDDAKSASRLRHHVSGHSNSLSSSSVSSHSSSPSISSSVDMTRQSTLAVDVASWRHPPAILPREDCILVSFGHIRAVAERDHIFLFDAGSGPSHSRMARSFSQQLAKIYRTRSVSKPVAEGGNDNGPRIQQEECFSVVFPHLQEEPPELVFLEAALSDVVDSFSRRIRILSPIVDDVVSAHKDQLEDVNDGVVIHQLAPLREQLQSLEVFVTQAYECLTTLLNDDDEMLKCLLTEQDKARRSNIPIDFEKHTQVEILLGVYARQFSSILQEVNYLLGRLQSKQEYIGLELALYRNRLIRMNVTVGIIAAATGITTAVTGTFGMNLISGLEESAAAFFIVTGGSVFTAFLMGWSLHHVVSGKAVQKRAAARIEEINILSSALQDITALDYTIKMIEEGTKMDREEFKHQLAMARHSQFISDEEVDLLFDVLNSNNDDFLKNDDFEENFASGDDKDRL